MREKHYVYILECADSRYYVGYTNNLERRMQAHACGKGAKFTRSFGFKKLLYHEKFLTKSRAMRREVQIKQLSRMQKTALILQKNSKIRLRKKVS